MLLQTWDLSFECSLSTNKLVHVKLGFGIFMSWLSSTTPKLQCLSQNTQQKHNNNTNAIQPQQNKCLSQNTQQKHNNNTNAIQPQQNKDPIKLQHNKKNISSLL